MTRFAPYAILALEVLVFYRHSLFGDRHIPWDLGAYHLPLAHLYSQALEGGELPLWDPYTYCGRPVQANIQAQVFYPPRFLLAALSPREWLFDGLEWTVALHVLVAGIFAFRLARSIGLGVAAALLVATMFQLGGFFAAHAEHLGAVCAAAWIPLALECVERRWDLRLAVALSLVVLAGFTPMTVIGWGTVALYAGLTRRAPVRPFLLAVGLCAVQLVPTWELVGLSVAKYRSDWLGDGGGVPLGVLKTLAWPSLASRDQSLDVTFQYLYCGLAAVPLAVWGARRYRPMALMAVSGVAMLGWLQRLLPEMISRSYYPEYAAAVFTLMLALLAGFGVQRLGSPWQWMIAAATAIDLLLVSSGLPMHAMPGPRDQPDPAIVARLRELTGAATPPSRIDTRQDGLRWVQSAPVTGIPTAGGYDPMALDSMMTVRRQFAKGERWGAYYEVERADSPVVAGLNVAYLVAGPNIEPVANVRPRFHIEGGSVRVVRYGLREVVLEADSPTSARLKSSEVHYPGWRAWVDGAEVSIALVDGAFRGHDVPAGRHAVRWRFEPRILYWSAAASGLSAVVCLVIAWRRWHLRADS